MPRRKSRAFGREDPRLRLGGRVELRLDARDESFEIRITDRGVGIPADELPHLFGPFWQGQRHPLRSGSGLGLGLSIVRRLVDLHRGTVSVESRGADQGATFTVTIRLPRSGAGAAEEARPRESQAWAPPRLEGVSVLLVEDERDSLELIGSCLEELGAETGSADSVAAALSAWESRRYEVVVSHLALPDGDGVQVIQEILRRTPTGARITAIAMSACTDASTRTRALEAGFQGFIGKPFAPDFLAVTTGKLVGRDPVPGRDGPFPDEA